MQEKTNWALRGRWGKHLETMKARGVQRPSKAVQRDGWETLLSIKSLFTFSEQFVFVQRLTKHTPPEFTYLIYNQVSVGFIFPAGTVKVL